MSSFLITINPNQSYHDIEAKGATQLFYKTLLDFIECMREGLGNGFYRKQYRDYKEAVKLDRFEYAIEVGKERGFMHVHILATFNKKTHINIGKLRAHCSGVLRSDGKNVHLNIRHVYNPLETVSHYLKKDKIILGTGAI